MLLLFMNNKLTKIQTSRISSLYNLTTKNIWKLLSPNTLQINGCFQIRTNEIKLNPGNAKLTIDLLHNSVIFYHGNLKILIKSS